MLDDFAAKLKLQKEQHQGEMAELEVSRKFLSFKHA
jgi:hypothetical protein